jgi:predicted DNA-binding transcriptional regulator AlpA
MSNDLLDMRLLDIKDVIHLFGCNENTFRTWIKRGQLPEKMIQRIGNTLKIRKAVLEQYLKGEI